MEKRYSALRVIGTIYKVLGFIGGAFTILAMLAICAISFIGGSALDSLSNEFGTGYGYSVFSSVIGGLVLGFFTLLYGGGISITLYAFGEGLYLLLAVEEHTRTTATLLERQVNPSLDVPPPD